MILIFLNLSCDIVKKQVNYILVSDRSFIFFDGYKNTDKLERTHHVNNFFDAFYVYLLQLPLTKINDFNKLLMTQEIYQKMYKKCKRWGYEKLAITHSEKNGYLLYV